jgi:FkbM family methyltransferase
MAFGISSVPGVNTLARARLLYTRKYRARRLGFRFRRAASFVIPADIQVGTFSLRLSVPEDAGTRTAFVDILLDDCYLLRAIHDDVKSVIDVGSHAGLFAIAARRRWPKAVIHCYEPNQCLKVHWSEQASQANFSVYQEALGENAGWVDLVSNDDSVQVRTTEVSCGAIKQTAFREAVNRIGGRVDLVKLDCEGAEWSILRDVESWSKVRLLTMEYHLWAGYSLTELEHRLAKLGFAIFSLAHTGRDFGLLSARRT